MEEAEVRMLPLTGGKYWITKSGQVASLGAVLPSVEKEDGVWIEIDWVDGLKLYNVAVLVAVTYLNIQIPEKFWCEIVPIYKDGNRHNTASDNVCYRYRRPLAIEGRPGFYYIPYFSRYGVTRAAEVIDLKRDQIKKWSISKPVEKKNIKGGYFYARIERDVGGNGSGYRHRLVVMAFTMYNVDPWQLVTNHKDGIPGNDFDQNLELITRAKNNKHAIMNGLTPNSIVKIRMKNLRTGEESCHNSISDAAAVSGFSWSTVMRRSRKLSHVEFDDGILFKIDDGTPWPEITVRKKNLEQRRVLVRNVFTGDITIYASANDAADDLQTVSAANIRLHCHNESVKPVHGNLFRFDLGVPVWPAYTEKHLKIYRMYPNDPPWGVLVTDSKMQEIAFYESVDVAAVTYGKSPITIDKRCRSGAVTPEGHSFSYYKHPESV